MKKIFICLVVLLLVGCSNKDLKNGYENMQVGKNKINGYSLDLRIYGKLNNKLINKKVKTENYMDKEYKITITEQLSSIINIGDKKEEVFYIKNGKTYVVGEDGIYKETSKKRKYSNPAIYLEGLKSIKDDSEPKEETIGENKYKLYNVTIKKDTINNILKDTDLDLEVEEDIKADIYLDSKEYVYRIIYYLEDLTINANYYQIDSSESINFEIDE